MISLSWSGCTVKKALIHSVETILAKAKVKYDLLQSQQKWGSLSKEAKAIIALGTKVDEMSSANLKLVKQLKDKIKKISSNSSNDSNKPG